MALYEYSCQNDHRTEIICRPSEREDKIVCPECGADAVKIISRTAPPKFNSSGFYATDYLGETR